MAEVGGVSEFLRERLAIGGEASCAGECGDPHGCGAGIEQGLGGGAGGGAGGENVVDEKDVLAGDGGGRGDAECAADIDTALARGESGLGLSGALAQQSAGGQGETPCGVGLGEEMERLGGHGAGLVEAAIGMPGAVQGHGDDEQFGGGLGGQRGDGVGEELAERAGGTAHAAVFEGVDGVFHAAVVGTVGDSALKWGRNEAAGAAERSGRGGGLRLGWGWGSVKRVAAPGTDGAAGGMNFKPANAANWHRGEMRQVGATEGAGGRQEGATYCIHGTSKHAGHGAPTGSLRWWNVERQ